MIFQYSGASAARIGWIRYTGEDGTLIGHFDVAQFAVYLVGVSS
jgi:hypothetical protein